MLSPIRTLQQVHRQYGWASAWRLLVDRLGAKLFQRHVMEVVWLDLQQAEACHPVEGFEFRFLTASEVQEFSRDPSLDLGVGMEAEVERGESLCFAALEGQKLAAYGWYALHRAQPQHCFGVGLELPDDVAYMFKGFTHPAFRGRRLHAAVMALALSDLSDRGIRGLISTVEWTNEASLRSCDRLGYVRLGRIAQSGPVQRRQVTIPPGIAAHCGVRFIPELDWKSQLDSVGC